MRPFTLFAPKHRLRTGVRSLLADLPRLVSRREDARNLPPHLLRDIGLSERRSPDWTRLLR